MRKTGAQMAYEKNARAKGCQTLRELAESWGLLGEVGTWETAPKILGIRLRLEHGTPEDLSPGIVDGEVTYWLRFDAPASVELPEVLDTFYEEDA